MDLLPLNMSIFDFGDSNLSFPYDDPLFGASLSLELEKDMFLTITPLTVSLIIMYAVVFILGLLGNAFVVMVVIKYRSMRTLTNVFLVNLTVGDLLVVCLCIPVTLGYTVYNKWIYGRVLCKLTPFIQCTAVGVSALSLLSISISRYFAIYKPLTAKILFSRKNIRYMLAGIWLLALASAAPLVYVNSVTVWGYPGLFESKTCEEQWPSMKDKHVYNIFIFCVLFVWPFFLMAVAYAVIAHTLWHGDALLFGSREDNPLQKRSSLILKKRRRTVKMLICVVIIFGICWLPYFSVNIWIDFHLNDPEKDTVNTVFTYVYPIALLMGLTNSAVNPICYCFLSHGFRRAFRQLFCGPVRRKSATGISLWRSNKSPASESVETADM